MADPTALFSVAEARAFDQAQLTSVTTYPSATIEATEASIRAHFHEACGVAFIPTTVTDAYEDGTGARALILPHVKLISVTACIIYDSSLSIIETFDATDLADLALYDSGKIVRRSEGLFDEGEKNVKITYKHGYTAVPGPIKRAALIVALDQLVSSNVGDRMTYMSDGSMTYSMAVAGRGGQEFGIPEVDSILQRYSYRYPGIA